MTPEQVENLRDAARHACFWIEQTQKDFGLMDNGVLEELADALGIERDEEEV